MTKEKTIIAGFDIGGAHLKAVRAVDGRIEEARIIGTPLWLGFHEIEKAFVKAQDFAEGADLCVITMTGELTDAFDSRAEGVAGLLEQIAKHLPPERCLIYAGRSGFVSIQQAAKIPDDVASANWHGTASLVAKLVGDAIFLDMGSTTTDIIATSQGQVATRGYSDSERMLSGELVYTGFVRSFIFGVSSSVPIRGRISPLMNEYFAAMSDVHRILGVLDEEHDKYTTADGKEKSVKASTTRLSRMVGLDYADLSEREWHDIAAWFSEQQLRLIHDAALRVMSMTSADAPIVGAGIGRWQIKRLAERMGRKFIDLAELIPADESVRADASSTAPATAMALLAAAQS